MKEEFEYDIQDMLNIPRKFKLFNTTYKVYFDNKRLNDRNEYGHSDYDTRTIVLSTSNGLKTLSDDMIKDTFFHELTHAILDSMNERKLSADERFVDVFGKLMRQFIETQEK